MQQVLSQTTNANGPTLTWRLLMHFGCTPDMVRGSDELGVHELNDILDVQNQDRLRDQVKLINNI